MTIYGNFGKDKIYPPLTSFNLKNIDLIISKLL